MATQQVHPMQVLHRGAKSDAARALQAATNRRLQRRGLAEVAIDEDGLVGAKTMRRSPPRRGRSARRNTIAKVDGGDPGRRAADDAQPRPAHRRAGGGWARSASGTSRRRPAVPGDRVARARRHVEHRPEGPRHHQPPPGRPRDVRKHGGFTHHVELYCCAPGQEFIGHGSAPIDSAARRAGATSPRWPDP
jgi:hypothetical protein